MSDWTEARVNRLKLDWESGLSANQCATRLGGVTRNAVIGKVHRLGLSGRAVATRRLRRKGTRPRGVRRKRTFSPPKAIMALLAAGHDPIAIAEQLNILVSAVYMARARAMPTEGLPPASSGDVARVSFLDLDEVEIDGSKQHCRFIPATIDPKLTKPWQPVYCGAKKLPGLPYCENHAKRCFTPAHTPQHAATAGPAKQKEFA